MRYTIVDATETPREQQEPPPRETKHQRAGRIATAIACAVWFGLGVAATLAAVLMVGAG